MSMFSRRMLASSAHLKAVVMAILFVLPFCPGTLSAAAGDPSGESWTESLDNWYLAPHG